MGDFRRRRRIVVGRLWRAPAYGADSTGQSAEGAALRGRRLLPDRDHRAGGRPQRAGQSLELRHGRAGHGDDCRGPRRGRRRVHHLLVQVRRSPGVRDAPRIRRRAHRQRPRLDGDPSAQTDDQPALVCRIPVRLDRGGTGSVPTARRRRGSGRSGCTNGHRRELEKRSSARRCHSRAAARTWRRHAARMSLRHRS